MSNKMWAMTGASSGIGKAVALALSVRGEHLLTFGRNAPFVSSTHISMDLNFVDDCAKKMLQFGSVPPLRLSGILLFAGVNKRFDRKGVFDDASDWDNIRINYVSQVQLVRSLAERHLTDGGTILLASSFLAQIGSAEFPQYAASKAAAETYLLSHEHYLAKKGKKIRTIILYPGRVNTPGNPKREIVEGVPFSEPETVAKEILGVLDSTVESCTIDLAENV